MPRARCWWLMLRHSPSQTGSRGILNAGGLPAGNGESIFALDLPATRREDRGFFVFCLVSRCPRSATGIAKTGTLQVAQGSRDGNYATENTRLGRAYDVQVTTWDASAKSSSSRRPAKSHFPLPAGARTFPPLVARYDQVASRAIGR